MSANSSIMNGAVAVSNGPSHSHVQHEMQVVKRNGSRETISFDKITKRIRSLGKDLHIDPLKISKKIIEKLYDGVSTSQLDELTAQQAESMSLEHPDYKLLAGNVCCSNHHKKTYSSFLKTVKLLYEVYDVNGKHTPIVCRELFEIARKHRKEIEEAIQYDRDFRYDYFAFQTLKRSYLLKLRGEPVERMQHLIMRVSLFIHSVGENVDLPAALETYNLLSLQLFTHATPTLFNAGTPKHQLSSCFLMGMEDSIDGIFEALKDVARISRAAGGVGLWVSDIRCKGSYIAGTNGNSNGLVPLLRTYNACARFVDQCLSANTEIITLRGPLRVEHLQPDDQVLSENGDFCKVVQVVEHRYTGDVIRLETDQGFVTCTPQHQLRTIRVPKHGSDPCARNLEACDYFSANELMVGDFLVSIPARVVYDVAKLTAEDCETVGMILRFGKLTEQGILFQQLPEEAVGRLRTYLLARGGSLGVSDQGHEWTQVDTVSSPLPFPLKLLWSDDTNQKPCLPSCMRHLPMTKLDALLRWAPKQGTSVHEGIAYVADNLDAMTTAKKVKFNRIANLTMISYEGSVYDVETEKRQGYAGRAGLFHSA